MQTAIANEDEFPPIPELDELYERLKNAPMSDEKRQTVQQFLDASVRHGENGDDIMAAAMRAAAAKGLELAVEG